LVSNAGIKKKSGLKAPSFKSVYSLTHSLSLFPMAFALYSTENLVTRI
jgi:hypothetical protein